MRQQDRSRRKTGQAHPIDVFVGTRIKQRRTELRVSLQKLSQSLDLTFQQLQKYETGANRVASSRLAQLAGALNVSVDYFFDGMPETLRLPLSRDTPATPADQVPQTYEEGSILNRSETLRLITNYYRIKSPERRRALYVFLKEIAEQS